MASGTIQNLSNESGSNANGNYIEFPNGIMICWGSRSNIGYGKNSQTFAKAFTSTPTVAISTGAGGGRFPVYVEDVTASGFTFYRPDTSSSSCWGRYIAVGFWKVA